MKKSEIGLGEGFHPKGRTLFLAFLANSEQILSLEKYCERGSSQVAQLVRAPSQYIKAACSIPSQRTYKNQPKNA